MPISSILEIENFLFYRSRTGEKPNRLTVIFDFSFIATQGIQNPSLVETLQERAQQALEDYISERSDRNHHFSLRYGKLLLRLPALSLLRSTPQMAPSCLFSGLVLDESLKENLILQTVYQCSNNV